MKDNSSSWVGHYSRDLGSDKRRVGQELRMKWDDRHPNTNTILEDGSTSLLPSSRTFYGLDRISTESAAFYNFRRTQGRRRRYGAERLTYRKVGKCDV